MSAAKKVLLLDAMNTNIVNTCGITVMISHIVGGCESFDSSVLLIPSYILLLGNKVVTSRPTLNTNAFHLY